MDWRLFLGTFVLIFFAELGDKTQLAAMASAAGGRSVWPVFAGASAALVLSTLIAVLVGGALQKLVPVSVIKTTAGLLFLVFGGLLLWSAARGEAAEPVAATAGAPAIASAGTAKPGFLSRAVLDAAARFEAAAAEDYEALAGAVKSAELKSLFAALMAEERRHLDRVEELSQKHTIVPPGPAKETPGEKAAEFPRFLWAGEEMLNKEMEILAAAIRQEKAKADFYTALAKSSVLPGLKANFLTLAREELEHMRRLQNARC